jgi:hypothetical protein
MMYGALDKRMPLEACFQIRDNLGITFREIVRAVKAKECSLHTIYSHPEGAGLFIFTSRGGGRSSSRYTLTDLGEEVSKELTRVVK